MDQLLIINSVLKSTDADTQDGKDAEEKEVKHTRMYMTPSLKAATYRVHQRLTSFQCKYSNHSQHG